LLASFILLRILGEIESGHYYSLIAAHLSPSCGADEWMALAETSLDFDKKDQALTCLASAIRSDKFNPDPRLRQIKLLTKMGQSKAVLRAREGMVRVIGSNTKFAQQHGRLILLQAKVIIIPLKYFLIYPIEYGNCRG